MAGERILSFSLHVLSRESTDTIALLSITYSLLSAFSLGDFGGTFSEIGFDEIIGVTGDEEAPPGHDWIGGTLGETGGGVPPL